MSLIIVFHNDGTGTDQSSNYSVTVWVNRTPIFQARIEGHSRASGWRRLVRLFTKLLES